METAKKIIKILLRLDNISQVKTQRALKVRRPHTSETLNLEMPTAIQRKTK
jgi:hypothetical protein